jgi:hypothetical protein
VAQAIEQIRAVLAVEEAGSSPTLWACRRRSRLATAWNVPAQVMPASRCRPQMRATRRVISAAARRVKVSRRILRGSAPRSISAATR